MLIYLQSEATAALRRFPVYLVDPTDGVTPVTGEVGTPTISKRGGAFAATTAALTEVGSGFYYVELTAAELDTLGMFTIHYASANVADFNLSGTVVGYDPFDAAGLGLSRLDAAISSRSVLAQSDILSDATAFAGADIDAAISSRSSHAAADVVAVTLSELTQGQPPATPTVGEALALLYMALRNQSTMDTSGVYTITDDAGTVICKATVSDDGTTVTVPKLVTGP